MTKTIPAPAMPLGARFDPEASILENARNARDYDKEIRRGQAEQGARILARRVFRRDDLEFQYTVDLGLDVPAFTIEDELVVFGNGEFALIEFCSHCGKEPKGRKFNSLATLGRVMEERDEAEPHVCRMCSISEQMQKGRK